ncbi:MAG: VCBS repeat-containing protein, partial [Bauldia sp.]|nr:VCBS repeat-containing protein [Bauldia sp.]
MAEPVLSGLPASLSYNFGDAATPIAPLLTVTDADSANLASASVRIVGGSFAGDGDILTADTTGTAITAVWNAANGTLFLSGSDTVENYQAVLRTVSYQSTATDPGNSGGNDARTLAWQVSDGTTLSTDLFSAASNYTGGGDARYSVASDVDGDGDLDLVTSAFSGTGVSVFLGNGDGTFGSATTYTTGLSPHGVAIGDINGDGIADVATANTSGSLSFLLGNGDGTFGTATTLATPGATAVAIVDLNHDGKADLVGSVAGTSIGNVVFLGNGDGTFATGVTYATTFAPHAMALGDFNGDGNVDIASATDNGTSILLGNGDGSFGTVTLLPGSTQWGIATADFDGDGDLDLAASMINIGAVFLYLGQGDGTFTYTGSLTAGSWPYDVATGDFNADGKVDLAVTATGSTAVSVFLGNGDGTFQSAIGATVGIGPYGIMVGDFDGAGGTDIVTANSSGTISILLNQTPGLSATEETTIELVDPSTIPRTRWVLRSWSTLRRLATNTSSRSPRCPVAGSSSPGRTSAKVSAARPATRAVGRSRRRSSMP